LYGDISKALIEKSHLPCSFNQPDSKPLGYLRKGQARLMEEVPSLLKNAHRRAAFCGL
jgi:hypothetical protein